MKGIFSYGIVRGLVGQIIGWAAGIGLVTGIRALMGLAYKAEPAWVVGAALGVIGFVIGSPGQRAKKPPTRRKFTKNRV